MEWAYISLMLSFLFLISMNRRSIHVVWISIGTLSFTRLCSSAVSWKRTWHALWFDFDVSCVLRLLLLPTWRPKSVAVDGPVCNTKTVPCRLHLILCTNRILSHSPSVVYILISNRIHFLLFLVCNWIFFL